MPPPLTPRPPRLTHTRRLPNTPRGQHSRCPHGLTLLELLSALLILSVVVSLSLPSYRRHLLAAHRAEAAQALHGLQLAQERFRSRQPRYAHSVEELAHPDRSPLGRYRLSVAQSSADGYVLEAEAQGEQTQDHPCLRLRLTQALGQVSHQGMASGTEQSSGCWPQ